MDIISIPKEQSKLTVSDKLLSYMIGSNYYEWLSHITSGRISYALLTSLEQITHSWVLKAVLEKGINFYDYPDEILIPIINKYHDNYEEISKALDEKWPGYKTDSLIKAINEHIPPDFKD